MSNTFTPTRPTSTTTPIFRPSSRHYRQWKKGSCVHSDYDATPVREELLKWGSNDQLSIKQLTRKVYWLLCMCNFLRPSDIARIDLNQSLLSESNFFRLCIVRPKETSGGIHRDKHIIVQAHPSELILCPVNTIRAYLDRHARSILKSPHPTLLDITIYPLIRYTKDATSALSSQRISKHIKSLMVLMPLANGSIPKARAAGSTIAALKGVPIDDVITQGNWASHSTYLRFYRISSRTRTNFTSVLLN
ncbi:hypothetical protein K457DRAFT_668756 [Linnemannia elongata AG-77]|uniref:Tyr recombinase domain-containing protein n=2 Tax=Linnemannia elongata AG-77 TaxID=1314771 RepID=A0A197JPZ7_9FUNG|nr:hypothetical protein K457DRAFT_668756 [Linnemannia elongata AG-77]